MNSVLISVTLYLISANIMAGVIYVFGQKKVGLLWLEYPFIYTPLIIFQFLMPQFMSIPDLAETENALKYFLFMLQGFSCGVIGAMILLPRFFIPATTTIEKLKVTALSSLAMGGVYLITRWIFFEALRFLIPQMRGG
ncbi:hypothetical protein Ga0123462_0178 [Mariprofundus ferrinatatus]|uniref:Uncharacterized protein n=1 Tax=Mariprofundus ferrinatatus TaxID=1921087 RepID=A0A2K8L9V8_9PROT|nr:hypothetical protein [Mariprofundus ferrinatatus]ATX81056.1 hypothetical protein Ga0123462_0178 [Mariprofundus ferrinatatus]